MQENIEQIVQYITKFTTQFDCFETQWHASFDYEILFRILAEMFNFNKRSSFFSV